MNKKMEDIDTDPFGEHESRADVHTDTGENIPLSLVGPEERSTWEPTLELGEQETSFGGRESQRNRLLRDQVEGLYEKLSQNGQEPRKYFTMTCLNSEMGNCTSEKRAGP